MSAASSSTLCGGRMPSLDTIAAAFRSVGISKSGWSASVETNGRYGAQRRSTRTMSASSRFGSKPKSSAVCAVPLSLRSSARLPHSMSTNVTTHEASRRRTSPTEKNFAKRASEVRAPSSSSVE